MSSEQSLTTYFQPLRRHLVVIAVLTLLGAAAGLALAIVVPPSYESTTRVLVNPVGVDPVQGLGTESASVDMATEAQVATSLEVVEAVNEILAGEPPAAPSQELQDRVAAEVRDESRVLAIRFEAGTPEEAQRGAATFAEAYTRYRQELAEAQVATIKSTLDARVDELQFALAGLTEELTELEEQGLDGGAQYTALDIERQSLLGELSASQRVLAELTTTVTDNAVIINEAQVPRSPSNLTTVPLVLSGVAGGLVLGIGAAYLLDALRDRRRNRADADTLRQSQLQAVPDPVEIRADDRQAASTPAPPASQPAAAEAPATDGWPSAADELDGWEVAAGDPWQQSSPAEPAGWDDPTADTGGWPAAGADAGWSGAGNDPWAGVLRDVAPEAPAATANGSAHPGGAWDTAPATSTSAWDVPATPATDWNTTEPWSVAAEPEPWTLPAAGDTSPLDHQAAAELLAAARAAVHPLIDRVQRRISEGARTTFVADDGDGAAAAVAWGLAHELAERGHRTLLIDVNLAHPTLHKISGGALQPGLAQALTGQIPPSQAIQPVAGVPGLQICHAGLGDQEQLFHAPTSELLDAVQTQFHAVILLGGTVPGSPLLQGFAPPPDAIVLATTGPADPTRIDPAALHEVQASCRPLVGIVSAPALEALT